ncbi:hypothetical protein GCM10011505_40630 [Tistrella bauzanensis]|uniref:Diguanylate cyclase n=1 Tax=Tistrella bauzanensis TaxID=657419 RepID=A0ABQ1IYF8_9PROT|nr:diguanylate cyclase [Tistrella bauzanensis]GGB55521.1 hypothetical protein GCM10011505_40630 [Tistrella bauzanensis]
MRETGHKPPSSIDPRHRMPDGHASHLRALHRIIIADHDDAPARFQDYLAAGRQILGMSVGLISHIVDDRFQVLAAAGGGLSSGDVFPLAGTYCAEVISRRASVALLHVGTDPVLCVHPAYSQFGFESYIAAPIWVSGRLFGTIAFMDRAIRHAGFHDDDIEFLEMMATAIGGAIARQHADDARRDAEAALAEAARLFSTAFEQAPIGMALVDIDGHWLQVNNAMCQILGYDEPELLAIDFQSITDPAHLESDLHLLRQLLAGEIPDYRIEKRYIRKDGRPIWAGLSVSLVRNDDGSPRYFVSQVQDIDEYKAALDTLEHQKRQIEAANQRLERLAATDPLTGLANRRAFMARFEQELTHHHVCRDSLCLLLADIDHFKAFNDRFGHPAGDVALCAVAAALAAQLRSGDMVARHGGEEFVVILPHTDLAAGRVLAKRLRQAVARIGDQPRAITLSIGITLCRPGAATDDLGRAALIAAADQALYQAKARGRNQVAVAVAAE